jgi:hypothetical protein
MLDKIITVIVNTCERLMLSALILLIMTFMPIAWSFMLYCDGSFTAASAGVMLFSGSVFFVYCFMRLLWCDIPLSDSSSLVF